MELTALRKRLTCAIAILSIPLAGLGNAQQYPSKPIRIVVPLAPGGGNDTVARLVGAKLSESVGQPVIIENRTGAGGVIASEHVARSPADGYTLYQISTTFTAAPAIHKKLPFDPVKDFTPITRVSIIPGAITVHASLPVKTLRQLLDLAKRRPGEVTYGSSGIGSGSHFSVEQFKMAANVDLLHVPYKGSALVTNALLAGEVMLSFSNPVSSLPHVKAGRLRILAVTSAKPWPLLPQFPAAAEAGVPGYEHLLWSGVAAPAGLPQAVLQRLHAELTRILAAPDIVERLARDGSRPQIDQPAEFAALIEREIVRAKQIMEATTKGTR